MPDNNEPIDLVTIVYQLHNENKRLREALRLIAMWPCESQERDTDTKPEECRHCIATKVLRGEE